MPKKILVVDDEKDIVEIYRKALTQAGYEIICAYNGEEGLNILRANPVDLVVLDLKMPRMTGDEFLTIVRGDPLLKDTRVLVMSSVLYRYKEIPRYQPDGRYARTDVVKEGLSKIGERADKTTKPEEGKLEMGEKTEARLEFTPVFGYEPEKEVDFERNLSEDLVRRVKNIFGEPYEAGKKKGRTVIEERIKDLIASYLKVDREKIYWDSTYFERDLGIAFIDAIPLRQRLEREFKVKIGWEDQQGIKTVGDLIWYIEHLKMQARTQKERDREWKRKFWEEWRSMVIGWMIFVLVGLAVLIWQLVIKKHFVK